MSVEAALSRIAEITGMLTPAQVAPQTTAAPSTSSNAFQSALTSAAAGPTASAAVMPQGGSVGQKMVALAQAEVGQAEQPPGSNDSPRIAQYRTATAGSGIGPWCAYFLSWAAKQAGVPLGESGQGFGSVSAIAGWAQRTGRWTPAGNGARPNPGDLILWGGEHMGMVESVDPDGTIRTIEGNSSDMVTRRTYSAGGNGATGFVRIG